MKQSIRVNAVNPGLIDTQIARDVVSEINPPRMAPSIAHMTYRP